MDTFVGFQLRNLDLAKFGYMIMNDGVWEGEQLIPSDWIQKITEELRAGPGTVSWGGWQFTQIDSEESIMARGEGGQYIVLSPELNMLIAVSSKSQFPLSENSGYEQLFQMIFESTTQKIIQEDTAGLIADKLGERPYYEPNFVYATNVPEDIRQFFHDLAKDIATQDINRILYHYAKGYENKGDNRLDNNRAYLRGTLKYSYANMNIGSIGWFPLENLIKLRGRWLWFGSPEYGAILDRDEYFDAEISADLNEFIEDCGPVLTGAIRKNDTACFSEGFVHNGLDQSQLMDMLQPFWQEDRKIKLHITKAEQSDENRLLQGYIENSLIGTISLPDGMNVIKENGHWKWAGNGVE